MYDVKYVSAVAALHIMFTSDVVVKALITSPSLDCRYCQVFCLSGQVS